MVQSLGYGGMEGRILRLARGLDVEEFEVHVLSLRPQAAVRPDIPPGTAHLAFPIPSGLHPLRLWRLSRLIRRGGYDIVHTHNWSSMFYGLLAGWLSRRAILIHGEHGLNFEDLRGTPRKRLLAQRLLAGLADRIVPVNAAIRKAVREAWGIPEGKVAVIVNGVDLGRFHAPARYPAGPGGGPVVGTVARLDKVKNLASLIAAFALWSRRDPAGTARLVIVGDGPLRGELEAQARALGVADRVEFAGESGDTAPWYARFSLFVNCSHYEGMSNTLLEAMACGLPLAASDVPGNAEWLKAGENALFFRPDDCEGMAAALRNLADDPAARARMGRANRARVEAEFSNQAFLTRYAALYRELLAARR